jgi:putative phage-type endonuclease
MSLIEYPQMQQRSPEWFAARRGIVTASVVGKLLTPTLKVADNDTSRGLTATLAAERITGITEDGGMTWDMQRGVDMEPFARDHYSGHYQQAVECGFLRREEDGWRLGLSPDGLVGTDGGVEVKCPRAKTHVLWTLADEVPAQHMAQVQAALLVTGRDWWDFASYCGGLPLFVKRVTPDPAWQTAIEAACRQFETNAAALVADYQTKTKGLPVTERVDLYAEIQVA